MIEKLSEKYIVNTAYEADWGMHKEKHEIMHGVIPGVGECDYMVVYDYEDKVEYEKTYLVNIYDEYFFLTDTGNK